MRVIIRAPRPSDEREFLAAVRRSRPLHHPWVHPPASSRAFKTYLARGKRKTHASFLACLKSTGELAGVFNLSEIVLGSFRSAYLGYYAFLPHAGRGHMTEALELVLREAFRTLKLHRIEANIQPDNRASLALARASGFKREGYSPRYLKIGGRWQDHERWAILVDDWRERLASIRVRRNQRRRLHRESGR